MFQVPAEQGSQPGAGRPERRGETWPTYSPVELRKKSLEALVVLLTQKVVLLFRPGWTGLRPTTTPRGVTRIRAVVEGEEVDTAVGVVEPQKSTPRHVEVSEDYDEGPRITCVEFMTNHQAPPWCEIKTTYGGVNPRAALVLAHLALDNMRLYGEDFGDVDTYGDESESDIFMCVELNAPGIN